MAVAYPKSTQEVSKIASICHKYRVPIVPYSGGTSLEGNVSCPYGGVSVDFAYMDQIVKFHKEDMDIVVQPSVSVRRPFLFPILSWASISLPK